MKPPWKLKRSYGRIEIVDEVGASVATLRPRDEMETAILLEAAEAMVEAANVTMNRVAPDEEGS